MVDLNKVEWDKCNIEVLKLLESKAEKLLEESVIAIRQATSRSYAAFAYYAAVGVYSTSKITGQETTFEVAPYLILFVGSFISIVALWYNLFPTRITHLGWEPKTMAEPIMHYETDELLRQYYINAIVFAQDGIDNNFNSLGARVKRFRTSVKLQVLALFLAIALWPWSFI